MIFPSKQDWWVTGILVATILLQSAAGVVVLIVSPTRWVGILLLLSAAFTGWLMRSTYYVVGETELTIRSGPFRWIVPLNEIDEITPSRSLLSSPALSLDRIRISYQHRGKTKAILISPTDKAGFLRAVIAQEPGLHVEDSTIIRR